MAKVSIIVPFFNCAPFLKECLMSIRKQSFADIEIIMIDDFSTDGSQYIAQEFLKDKRFKLFFNLKNEGVSYCRNKGLTNSTGEYVFFVDSDDIIHPKCIEFLFNILAEENADVAICGYKNFVDRCNFNFDVLNYEVLSNNEIMRSIACCDVIQNFSWGKLFKREFFSDITFPNGRIFEDIFPITYALSKSKKTIFIHNTLYFYRQNISSLSRTIDILKIQDFFLAMKEKGNFIYECYPHFFKYMAQSFFELFYLRKKLKISKNRIMYYTDVKMLYKKCVRHSNLEQKIKYLIVK